MQTGAPGRAVAELEGERLLTRASPEVDAALAAMLWVERPTPKQRAHAESLWDSAMQLEPRLSAPAYVSETRRRGTLLINHCALTRIDCADTETLVVCGPPRAGAVSQDLGISGPCDGFVDRICM